MAGPVQKGVRIPRGNAVPAEKTEAFWDGSSEKSARNTAGR